MRFLLGAALALAVSAPAHAVSWRLVGNNDEIPAIVAFVDADSVQRSGDTVSFVLIYYVEGETADSDIGVRQQRVAICSTTNFQVSSERRWIGPTEQPEVAVDTKFTVAGAGSIDESSINMVCGSQAYIGGPISDPDSYAKNYFADLSYEEDW